MGTPRTRSCSCAWVRCGRLRAVAGVQSTRPTQPSPDLHAACTLHALPPPSPAALRSISGPAAHRKGQDAVRVQRAEVGAASLVLHCLVEAE